MLPSVQPGTIKATPFVQRPSSGIDTAAQLFDTDHVRAKRRESCAREWSGDKGRELNDPEPGKHAHVTHPSQVRACSLETLVSRLRGLNPSRAHTLRGALREAATAYAIAGSSESTSAARSEMRATSFLYCGFAPGGGVVTGVSTSSATTERPTAPGSFPSLGRLRLYRHVATCRTGRRVHEPHPLIAVNSPTSREHSAHGAERGYCSVTRWPQIRKRRDFV